MQSTISASMIRVRISPPAVAELLEAPLGNHLVLVPGHVKALFREAFDLGQALR